MKLKLSLVAVFLIMGISTQAQALEFQSKFDYIGPQMNTFTNSQGRDLTYIDVGEKDWQVVLFLGGSCTSTQAFHMTEFARTLRQDLKLRVISVGRNGFGMTPFTPGLNLNDYARDVKEVLDYLKVEKFSAIAISGGGTFLSVLAEAMPDRLISLHFAAAFSYNGVAPKTSACDSIAEDVAAYTEKLAGWVQNPTVWWDLGNNTSIQKIPAFQDTANNEGAHSFFVRGQMGDPAPAVYEYATRCQSPRPEKPSAVTVPVFIYQGDADKAVTTEHAEFWAKHYANSKQITTRLYPGEGHDVQYRHWDQILLDMAGQGDRVLICEKGKAFQVAPADADKKVKAGQAILGLCAWE